MNVLPSSTQADAADLKNKVLQLYRRPGVLEYKGKQVLTTFGGADAKFGVGSWQGFLRALREDGVDVCSWRRASPQLYGS